MSVTFGRTSPKQFAEYDPDTSSWKTWPDIGLWGSTPFSGTWPRSGMTRSGRAFELPMSVHLTAGSECSSWLATRTAWLGRRAAHSVGDAARWTNPERSNELSDQIAHLFPTPTATPYGSNQSDSPGAAVRPSLDSLVHLLPTPAAHDSGNTPEDHLRKKPGRTQVTSLQVIVDHGLLSTGGRIAPQSDAGSD